MIQNSKFKIQNSPQAAFTLIELMVAIFIFSLITVGIVSVFVSTVTSYGKAKAIKTVKENAEFAMSSIAKDVRMGKIEKDTKNTPASRPKSNSLFEQYLMVTRNRGGTVCYYIATTFLGIKEGIVLDTNGKIECPLNDDTNYNRLVDLSATGMKFDSTAGFYSLPTDTTSATKRRGWVEINLNIVPAGGISSIDMSTDTINVQTIVSSRDYGWEDI